MFNKILLLKEVLPVEITQEVAIQLMGDKRTPQFARHIRQVLPGRDQCLKMLENASSRKNGFFQTPNPEEENTEDPHWVYFIENQVVMQSINCSHCGGYIWSNTLGHHGLPVMILCFCDGEE
jgi:hypothetical protein